MMPRNELAAVIDALNDGDSIHVYVDPRLYQPCQSQLTLLGLPAMPQWVRATLLKNTQMHSALLLAHGFEPLPITRTYRRCGSYGLGGYYKRAFFSYVKWLSTPTIDSERGL